MSLITDGQAALKAAASASGESLAAARTQAERRLKSAGAALSEVSQPVIDGTRKSAAAADVLVRGHPWTVAGVSIAAGIVLGYLAAKRSRD